jgi:diamine N-acetyltransferase
LTVSPEQEGLVWPNANSIAEFHFKPSYVPLIIYHDETMVGFTMYNSADYMIARLMIDQRYQRRGYGRAAMQLLFERLEREYAHPTISVSFVPGNTAAEQFYLTLGFQHTGEIEDDEIVLRRDLRQKKEPD